MGNLWSSLNPNDWFTDEERGAGVNVAADPYKSVRDPLLNWLSGQIGQTGPSYQNQTIAPLSDQEKQSLEYLNQYGKTTTSPTYGAAMGEINKTLTDNYNPATSPYYQAVKAEAARNLKDVQENIDRNTPSARAYFSGARIKNQSRAATDTAIGLNNTLGQLALQERQNKLSILPQALQYLNVPLQQAEAYQNVGALPRQIEQAKLSADLEDWLRSNYQYPMDIAGLSSNVQQEPLYQQNTPSFLYELLTSIAPELAKAAGSAAAGGV